MARHEGPVKGTITIVNTDTAESYTVITEPIAASTAQFTALESGTAEVTGTIADDALGHPYYEFSITTTGGATVTGTRRTNATKGLLVFHNEDDAITASYIVEPLLLSNANYNSVLAGDNALQITMFEDGLGHKFFEAEMI